MRLFYTSHYKLLILHLQKRTLTEALTGTSSTSMKVCGLIVYVALLFNISSSENFFVNEYNLVLQRLVWTCWREILNRMK